MSGDRPIDRVLARLCELSGSRPRRCGNGWMAICCGHKGGKEGTESLSVAEGDDGKVLLNCHADECSYASIVSGLGMEEADLFPPREEVSGREKRATVGDPRVTLRAFAEFLALPIKFLVEQGLEDHSRGVSLPFRDEADRLLFRKIRGHLTDKKLKYRYEHVGTEAVPYGLWRLPQAREAKYLVVTEGETDWLTLEFHGINALGLPGAKTTDKLMPEHVAGIETIHVIREPGNAGEMFASKMGERLAAIGWNGEARVIRMSEEVKDPSALHKADPKMFKARFRELYQRAIRLDAPKIRDMFDTLEDVEEEPIEFLWWPYLIRGGLNIVMGAPGEGKGQTTMALAAAITAGAPLPGETEGRPPGEVLIFSPEDNTARILKKRFRLAGGDGKRAHAFKFQIHDFSFEEEDRMWMEAALDEFDPTLVIFDPFAKFGERVNLNDAKEVSAILRPMAEIFDRREKCTVVLVAHTKKGAVARAAEGLSGNTQISAIVRSIVGVYGDPKRRATAEISHGLWTHVKHNYSPEGRSIRFTLTNGEDNFSRFAWSGFDDSSAQDIASSGGGGTKNGSGNHYASGGDSGPATEEACSYLRELFASTNGDGSLNAADVQRLAREVGISQATLHRARARLGIKSKRAGEGAASRNIWYLTRPEPGEDGAAEGVVGGGEENDDSGEEAPF